MSMTISIKEAMAAGRLDADFLIRNAVMKNDKNYLEKVSTIDLNEVKELFYCLDISAQKNAVEKIKRGGSLTNQNVVRITLNEYPLLCLYLSNIAVTMKKYSKEIESLNQKLDKLKAFSSS